MAGIRVCWATIAPSGPSLEKTTSSGSELRTKRSARIIGSKAGPRNARAFFFRPPGADSELILVWEGISCHYFGQNSQTHLNSNRYLASIHFPRSEAGKM